MRPPCDVAFVLVRNTERKPIKLHTPSFREVKNVLMTIVKKPLRIDWLEMTVRFYRGFDPHRALRVRLSLAGERIEVKVGQWVSLTKAVEE